MSAANFSYRHLHYFWVVAHEGGMARGAARLGVAVQTVSAQVHELERALGHQLLRPAGRGLALTDAGRAALAQADRIFELGQNLPKVVRDSALRPVRRLVAGIADGLAKLVVQRLLQPIINEPNLRLLCHEGDFESLMGELALHRVDVVLADRAAPHSGTLRLYSHSLATSEVSWYAAPRWQGRARDHFPASLATVPVILPTVHSVQRPRIEQWFASRGIEPRVVGEFEDSALLKTFGASGLGVFPAPDLVHADLVRRYGVKRVGPCESVRDYFFAIGTQRKIENPLVQRLLPVAGTTPIP
jgi:LysR family transcriptional activator of nhaA